MQKKLSGKLLNEPSFISVRVNFFKKVLFLQLTAVTLLLCLPLSTEGSHKQHVVLVRSRRSIKGLSI